MFFLIIIKKGIKFMIINHFRNSVKFIGLIYIYIYKVKDEKKKKQKDYCPCCYYCCVLN